MMIRKPLVMAALLALSGAAFAEKGSEAVTSSPVPDGCTAIPDNGYTAPTNGITGMVCRVVTVPAGTINNPEIVVGLDHTWIGDVTVKVVPPSGSPVVTLFNRPGRTGGTGAGSSANFAPTHPLTFRDSSTNDPETMGTGLTSALAVCRDGSQLCDFRTNRDEETLPNVTSLAALNGQSAGGTWQVCVGDGGALDTGSLCTATITASAAGPVTPTYAVTPTALPFPATEVGSSSNASFVVGNITPTGGPALNITGCTLGGANAGDFGFVTAPTFPVTLAAGGASATFAVRFSPSQPGARTGSVTCTTNAAAPNTTFTVSFTGTGTVPFRPVPSTSALGQWLLLGLVLGMGAFFAGRRQG